MMSSYNTKMQAVADKESLVWRWLKQAAESADILNKTINIHEFFSNYDLYLSALAYLAECEKVLNFGGELPSKALVRAVEERGKQTRYFISRFAMDTKGKVSKLPTKKAKMKRIESFYKTLSGYSDRIDNDNSAFIIEQYEAMQRDIK